MKVKFTTKKDELETGLAAITQIHRGADIKLKRKVVGRIFPPNRIGRNSFTIGFMFKSTKKPFIWRKLAITFNNYDEAKRYLTEKSQLLYDSFKDRGLELYSI